MNSYRPQAKNIRAFLFKMVAISIIFTFCTLSMLPMAWSQEPQMSSSDGGNASGAGMQVAAVLSTILYAPFKVAFAIGGGIVGGLTYAFTGGNESAAKSVWTTSMYGTYLITPDHLRGDKAIRFLGVPDSTDMPSQVETPYQEPVR
ncbi:hypothetical protein [Petrachloros mirabilis]